MAAPGLTFEAQEEKPPVTFDHVPDVESVNLKSHTS
jgi:hypothetical protein